MAQYTILDKPTRDWFKKIRQPYPQIGSLDPLVYPKSDDKPKCDPPNDWLDDPLVALSRKPGPYTFENADEYLDTQPVELYNGWLVRQEMSDFKAKIFEGGLHDHLSSAARLLGFGAVVPDQMECLLSDGTTIKPDLSLVSWERQEQRVIPRGPNDRPTLMGSPEFVVEVRSPSNRRAQEREKRKFYFENGAELIWDIDEEKAIIYVYRVDSQDTAVVYTSDDVIDCEPLLPGWTRQVSDLFEPKPSVEVMFSEVIEEGERRGEKRGEQRGEQRSKQDMLIRLLQARFPDVPEQILSVVKQTQDIALLDSWFNQALMIQALDEISFVDEI